MLLKINTLYYVFAKSSFFNINTWTYNEEYKILTVMLTDFCENFISRKEIFTHQR